MNSKVICFFVLFAAVHSAPQHEAAARFPAGVNPALCPGFPICDNALLHGTAPVPAAPAYHAAPAPVWNGAPAQSYSYQSAQAYDDGQYRPEYDAPAVHDYSTNDISGPGGDKYPAGVNPAACPNYPYCDNGIAGGYPAPAPAAYQARAFPAPQYPAAQYPANVNPATCPDYPYCGQPHI